MKAQESSASCHIIPSLSCGFRFFTGWESWAFFPLDIRIFTFLALFIRLFYTKHMAVATQESEGCSDFCDFPGTKALPAHLIGHGDSSFPMV